MLAYFEEIPTGSRLEADICIIGAGPAGIAMAREFEGTDLSVLLIESGGLDFDKETQNLYRGINERGDFKLHKSRFRIFGGTSYVWGGWCAPLDASDFETRAWVKDSGWPIKLADLTPFYRRAQPLFELGPYRYQVDQWDFGTAETLPLDRAKLRHILWQLSPPTVFGTTYLDELRTSKNIRVLLQANATEIVTDAVGSSVTRISLQDFHGRKSHVFAGAYVIACGGIETARLLLSSSRDQPWGLGNGHDLVGRFFMEHPHPDAGGVVFSVEPDLLRAYYEREFDSGRIILGWGPSAEAQEKLGILNCSVALHGSLHHGPSEGMDSLVKLARALESRRWPDDVSGHVWRVLRDLDNVLRESYMRATEGPVTGFGLIARTEVAPNPSNRLIMSDEKDELGMPRVKLVWNVGDLERLTVERTVNLLAQEFGRLGMGRVRINELLLEDNDTWSRNLSWFGHHMGTTRMSENPRTGVVDVDCKLHGMSNLYVASSSVFPTCGYANPTLTIGALAIRLADHLKGLAGQGSLRNG
jgi:choline dehydrogenase-like flavoprotein